MRCELENCLYNVNKECSIKSYVSINGNGSCTKIKMIKIDQKTLENIKANAISTYNSGYYDYLTDKTYIMKQFTDE